MNWTSRFRTCFQQRMLARLEPRSGRPSRVLRQCVPRLRRAGHVVSPPTRAAGRLRGADLQSGERAPRRTSGRNSERLRRGRRVLQRRRRNLRCHRDGRGPGRRPDQVQFAGRPALCREAADRAGRWACRSIGGVRPQRWRTGGQGRRGAFPGRAPVASVAGGRAAGQFGGRDRAGSGIRIQASQPRRYPHRRDRAPDWMETGALLERLSSRVRAVAKDVRSHTSLCSHPARAGARAFTGMERCWRRNVVTWIRRT